MHFKDDQRVIIHLPTIAHHYLGEMKSLFALETELTDIVIGDAVIDSFTLKVQVGFTPPAFRFMPFTFTGRKPLPSDKTEELLEPTYEVRYPGLATTERRIGFLLVQKGFLQLTRLVSPPQPVSLH